MAKLEATINVIRYDLIVKKPTLTYEQLMQIKKELKNGK
jgi:hypothetical protein